VTSFSASAAAAHGFSLIRREPRAAVAWAVLSAAATVLVAWGAGQRPGVHAVTIAVDLLANLAITGAALRAWMRPDERAFAYVRLGRDEQRLLICAVVALAPAVLLLAVLIRLTPTPPLLAGTILSLGVWAWYALRLSPAGALSIRDRALKLGEAWSATAGLGLKPILAVFLTFVFIALSAMGLGLVTLILQVLVTVGQDAKTLASPGPLMNLVSAALAGGLASVGLVLWAGIGVSVIAPPTPEEPAA
jgi:hypothetical protein